MKFEDFTLAPEILKAIADTGYTEPTPIQAQAIPEVLAGHDIIGIAQTGTGKTASFTLPMIHRLMRGRARARMPRTLILEPTRELAAQVADNFDTYGKHTKLTKALLIGGVSFGDQERAIMRGADVLIATPGRLLDHIGRGKVLLRGVEVLVIDEADRMLDMGFIPDIEKIIKLVPFTRQTLLFSATMPPEITRLANEFLSAPKRIETAPPASTNVNVRQALVTIAPSQKREALRKLISSDEVKNAIVFCNRKRDIADLLQYLKQNKFSVAALHGDMDQHARLATLNMFKSGEATYLIASDVAARGLDIANVSHIFNFDVPTHPEDYVHRIGRTGRAGRTGVAYTLATKNDDKYVSAIESLIKQPIPKEALDLPKGAGSSSSSKPNSSRSSSRNQSRNSKPTPTRSKNTSASDKPKPSGSQSSGRRRGFLNKDTKDSPAKDSATKDTPKEKSDSFGDNSFGNDAPAFLQQPTKKD
ncbi:MAG: DEAD/DEAH box helicase [Alphaproteobacteria bacterium]|nr:DEAD/DEAH box helicase [Alphaproteobacteria bacterium]